MLTTKKEIEMKVKSLMMKHGVLHWDFEWSSARRALGKCAYKVPGTVAMEELFEEHEIEEKRIIKLSKPIFLDIGMDTLVDHGVSEDLLEDTILHEIAHAIDVDERGDTDHSYRWKEVARDVGADPTRCAESLPEEVKKLIARWIVECPSDDCDERFYYYREPEKYKRYCCARCSGGDYNEKFAFQCRKNPNRIF